tara:strand:- start:550 stop:834 length:285 start_codon:yes stop_codon:yes gene_type:complete
MNVKVFRMNTGEEIICTIVSECEQSVEIENALVAIPNASGQVGFGPWSFLQKEKTSLTVDRSHIVYICDARDEVVENYENIFSPIKKPSKSLIL